MGRTLKNEHHINSISCLKDRSFELYHVKIPFHTKVTFKEVYAENKKINKKYYWTGSEIYPKPITEKDEIKKEFKKQNKIVIKIEELTTPMTDHCPQCHKHGIPKIERKNASDHRLYLKGTKKERPDEYYVTYTHKINGKTKQCKIVQYIKDGFYFKKNMRKNSNIDEFMFPRVLESDKLLFFF